MTAGPLTRALAAKPPARSQKIGILPGLFGVGMPSPPRESPLKPPRKSQQVTIVDPKTGRRRPV